MNVRWPVLPLRISAQQFTRYLGIAGKNVILPKRWESPHAADRWTVVIHQSHTQR